MQKAGTFSQLWIQTQLGSHRSAKISSFAAMHQQVLAIGITETHTSHHSYQFFMQAMYTQFNNSSFSNLHYLVLYLFAGFFYYFFNTGRMYTAIGHQSL